MSNDPYRPPSAEVQDPPVTRSPPPQQVSQARLLIWASLALGLLELLPGIRPELPDAPDVPLSVTLGLVVIFGGITLWLADRLHGGKNWARWAMLVYMILGWATSADDFGVYFTVSPIAGMISLACIALELVACWFLFTGAGDRWFAELSGRRPKGTSAP